MVNHIIGWKVDYQHPASAEVKLVLQINNLISYKGILYNTFFEWANPSCD